MATRKDRIISINALIKTNLSFLRLLVSFYAKSMDIMTWTLNCYAIAFFIPVVENIEKRRQPYPTLDAVYFLTPCRESVLRLLDDFTAQKTPMYRAAHVHFTSGMLQHL